ncbi:MAG: TVP38/TMEM64 family protein [Cyclobacteriaceae bacterium]
MGVRSRVNQNLKQREEERKQSIWVFIVSGGIILAIILSYFLIPEVKVFLNQAFEVLTSDDTQLIEEWVSGFDFWGPLIIVAAMVAQMFLIVIPSPLLMIVSTLAYGPFWGSLISYVAVVVAATVAYFIGYHASNAFIDRLIGQKTTEKVNYYIQKYGAWAVVIFRVSPFLSNDAISFVAGLGEMKFVKFILATTAGIIPLIAMIGFLGENTERLKTGMLWVSVLTIVGFAIYFLIKRHQKNKPQHAGE